MAQLNAMAQFLGNMEIAEDQIQTERAAKRAENAKAFATYMDAAAANGRPVDPMEVENFYQEHAGNDRWLQRETPARPLIDALVKNQNERAQMSVMERNAKVIQLQKQEQQAVSDVFDRMDFDEPDANFAEGLTKAYGQQGAALFQKYQPFLPKMRQDRLTRQLEEVKKNPVWEQITDPAQIPAMLPNIKNPAVLDSLTKAKTMELAKLNDVKLANFHTQLMQQDWFKDMLLHGAQDDQLMKAIDNFANTQPGMKMDDAQKARVLGNVKGIGASMQAVLAQKNYNTFATEVMSNGMIAEDIKAGRWEPAEPVVAELARKNNVPWTPETKQRLTAMLKEQAGVAIYTENKGLFRAGEPALRQEFAKTGANEFAMLKGQVQALNGKKEIKDHELPSLILKELSTYYVPPSAQLAVAQEILAAAKAGASEADLKTISQGIISKHRLVSMEQASRDFAEKHLNAYGPRPNNDLQVTINEALDGTEGLEAQFTRMNKLLSDEDGRVPASVARSQNYIDQQLKNIAETRKQFLSMIDKYKLNFLPGTVNEKTIGGMMARLDEMEARAKTLKATGRWSGQDLMDAQRAAAAVGDSPAEAAALARTPASRAGVNAPAGSSAAGAAMGSLEAQFEQQSREIAAGTRRDYDQALVHEMARVAGIRRKEDESAYLKREQRQMLTPNPMMR